jgi:hypothetical protein
MFRTLLLVFAVGIGSADVASAQFRTVYGAGTVSCGQWQQFRTTGDKVKNFQLQAWIDGYLSGSNAASNDDFLAEKSDSVSYYFWIDNYCRDKPLDVIVQAVSKLKEELSARALKRR